MWSPLAWFERLGQLRRDMLVSALLVVLGVLAYGPWREYTWLAACCALVSGGLLLIRRRHPAPVAAVLIAALAAAVFARADLAVPLLCTTWPAVHALAACPGARPRRIAGLLLTLAAAGFLLVMFTVMPPGLGARSYFAGGLGVAGYLGTAWFAGRYTAMRAASIGELRARAERAAADERAWLARELHDMLAHTMSGMVVLAGGARRLADQQPAAALTALDQIERTGRAGMTQTRALVRALRESEEPRESGSLTELGPLTEPARAAGISITVHGDPGELPKPVDSAAYRIVQEAVTNTLRHSDAARIDIDYRRTAGELEIEIRDDGTTMVNTEPGFGIAGMRERARLFGGELTAGRTEHGWTVHTRLEVPE
ncbi:sensor histidine kinase [Sciscionella sediminilitoris]|uniref:sensor histidine kinase n=1 Tax=Sciscionella sediminilitoris TaxID=1445613 RepID=UPI0012E0D711|nr:histidine kinase [Sciscionella sp. SE31]